MANSYLIEIGINDSTQDIVRKCNSNFRRLAMDQLKQSRASVRQESSRTDAELEKVVENVNAALSGAIEEINQAIQDGLDTIEEKFNKKIEDMYPPIGTYIHCTYDPNIKYPGTIWIQDNQATILMSSGSSYTPGTVNNLTSLSDSQEDVKVLSVPLWHRTK